MIELFAAMYMVCNMSMSDPDISASNSAQAFPKEITAQVQGDFKKIEDEQERQRAIAREKERLRQLALEQEKRLNAQVENYGEELKKLGYYSYNTGDSDLNTRSAILHFQSSCNLNLSGIWDDQSKAALKKYLKTGSFTYTDTMTSPASNGKWITINKSKRILTLYDGRTVIKKYPVAVGNPSSLTPSGKHYIVCKIVNPTWGGDGYAEPIEGGLPNNPLGYRWIGLSPKGGSQYGVHGNVSPYSIGTYASHGCVRMFNFDVESLYEIVSANMPVWIGDEGELNSWGISQNPYK